MSTHRRSPIRPSRRRARTSFASTWEGVAETDVRTALTTGDMGFLHSFTTGSAVDGPACAGGVDHRLHVRCQYCTTRYLDARQRLARERHEGRDELRKYRRPQGDGGGSR